MTCPICRAPTEWKDNRWRPFCSERCQLTDLGTWATGGYRIPGTPLTIGPDSLIDEEPDAAPTESISPDN
ncbi:MAG: DNA gyrase inhibitor YacG [Nitrospira sp.]|nr:MAG: DNA gyrase inhibitor YacG [Nitrospira sp.]